MEKEIHEQPIAIQRTLEGRLEHSMVLDDAFGANAAELLAKVEHVQIIACGTSYHAGMTARYWFESFGGVSCNVEIASEYRYRESVVRPNSLLVTISQSGETADTLAALKLAQAQGYMTSLTICNAPASSLVRESDMAYLMKAGVEIGVASTKAFTVQLTGLLMLAAAVGRHHGMDEARARSIGQALLSLPAKLEQVIGMDAAIVELAEDFADKHHALFLGRGDQYPIAMEGALKLKEISYIHAEAYAAGEPQARAARAHRRRHARHRRGAEQRARREAQVQRRGGARARRADVRVRRPRRPLRLRRDDEGARGARTATRSSRRSSTPCRCSCCPTTSP